MVKDRRAYVREAMSYSLLLILIAAIATPMYARSEDAKTRSASGNEILNSLSSMSMEKLKSVVGKGREKLADIVEKDETPLDRSMRELQEAVCASAERAKRLSSWDIDVIGNNAEASFDETIDALESYLDFVEDDGIVHVAAKKIRQAALNKESVFNSKANAKDSDRYRELAAAMRIQANRADAAWTSIRDERKSVEESVKRLKDSRELYIDVKQAQGIGAAVRELEAVREDLNSLSEKLREVQEAIVSEAEITASRLQQE